MADRSRPDGIRQPHDVAWADTTHNRHHDIMNMENTMASLSQRLRAFLASPQGRRLVEQGQRQLARPENQRKLRQLLTKLQNRK
jgi:hypothetical protein